MSNAQIDTASLTNDEMDVLERYWRAANYLSVGQIYLMDNPLLDRPLEPEHIKPRLLGHWGTTPGLNFIYTHLNRIITKNDLEMIYVCGPGHGGPGMLANTWLEGSYSEIYPHVPRTREGMQTLFRQFSFPGGVPSHAAPETPGSMHEGGELGYSLAHAFGAVFDNPDLIAACVVGDGEAETGALATSWHSNTFLNPEHDGAVLPILHLNGYKIANPTILARFDDQQLRDMFSGFGWEAFFVEGEDHAPMHRAMAETLDRSVARIHEIQKAAREGVVNERPRWPMIVLRSPKGWTAPKQIDGKKLEGFWRAHQVPIGKVRENGEHRKLLEEWMRSYRPEELFDPSGRPMPDILKLVPDKSRLMGLSPHTNGGVKAELKLPEIHQFALDVSGPGETTGEATRTLGKYLAEVMRLNAEARNFRLMGPDETTSNRLDAVFEETDRVWMEPIEPYDDHLAHDGRVMEVLSEHLCQGWLEGYLLSGRHGWFACYEAFIHIIDSMFNQHAKWLKVSQGLEWRKPVASLNYLLTSHVWRQDHNGFSHQDPGFLDHVANKKADIVRIYLPPDANSLLWVSAHCLQTTDRVNVIVAGKQPSPQWMNLEETERHCRVGAGAWDWAGSVAEDEEPDIVMACAGDVPTLETLAAVQLLREALPKLKIRVVNVVDLMSLQPEYSHPHGLSDRDFDQLFTTDRPIVFAHHGYPYLIHRLAYKRHNHANLHVHGYREEGTTTTPFDMAVLNEIDRFHLALAALKWMPDQGEVGAKLKRTLEEKLDRHTAYIKEHGEDMPEILEWQWRGAKA
ncbi:putative phosphoketolase [Devosia pacifica]|uniref:Probable phosphoketolase n=1 Tax=Devosia pacifica TaxID=1335967 RepID=A0A918SC29_9HYPH|nr:phosphoketolase family protein [Devosia pacifica]GHA32721.1 putative phosphoketolase [Devosia pacifica]